MFEKQDKKDKKDDSVGTEAFHKKMIGHHVREMAKAVHAKHKGRHKKMVKK